MGGRFRLSNHKQEGKNRVSGEVLLVDTRLGLNNTSHQGDHQVGVRLELG